MDGNDDFILIKIMESSHPSLQSYTLEKPSSFQNVLKDGRTKKC